jgi:hypothetical protein
VVKLADDINAVVRWREADLVEHFAPIRRNGTEKITCSGVLLNESDTTGVLVFMCGEFKDLKIQPQFLVVFDTETMAPIRTIGFRWTIPGFDLHNPNHRNRKLWLDTQLDFLVPLYFSGGTLDLALPTKVTLPTSSTFNTGHLRCNVSGRRLVPEVEMFSHVNIDTLEHQGPRFERFNGGVRAVVGLAWVNNERRIVRAGRSQVAGDWSIDLIFRPDGPMIQPDVQGTSWGEVGKLIAKSIDEYGVYELFWRNVGFIPRELIACCLGGPDDPEKAVAECREACGDVVVFETEKNNTVSWLRMLFGFFCVPVIVATAAVRTFQYETPRTGSRLF